jgi:hypothetical protein
VRNVQKTKNSEMKKKFKIYGGILRMKFMSKFEEKISWRV